MAKKKGASHLAVLQRREHVKRLLLHGSNEREICKTLGVSEDTVTRDVRAVFEDWKQAVKAQDIYSMGQAFDFLMELRREYWTIYHRPPRELRGPKGAVIREDRSRVQIACLDSLLELGKTMNAMSGIGSPSMFERLRFLESEKARGFEIPRIPFEEQMRRGVEELRKNIGLQRREGLIRDSANISPP